MYVFEHRCARRRVNKFIRNNTTSFMHAGDITKKSSMELIFIRCTTSRVLLRKSTFD